MATSKSAWAGARRALARLNDPSDRRAAVAFGALLLLAEALLCAAIIARVPCERPPCAAAALDWRRRLATPARRRALAAAAIRATHRPPPNHPAADTEIDWEAYMEEVGGFLAGERDYRKLRGGTGPLVYPAGFVYLFAGLRRLTGGAVRPAQAVFAGLYLATQAAVGALYVAAAATPPWALALLCASRRVHSLFLLRLFNDCWAMLLAYAATRQLAARRHARAIVLYSAAVSIKMNVLLFAPGVLAVLVKDARPQAVGAGVAAGVALQAALGAPFLLHDAGAYLGRAFEFSRVFAYRWSVNGQLLPERAFLSPALAAALLAAHAALLARFAERDWFAAEGGARRAVARFLARGRAPAPKARSAKAKRTPTAEVLRIVFAANFVGVACARSLHYQFYSWYFHTLPFLLLEGGRLPAWAAVAVLAGVEAVWNVYPPRAAASAALLALHLAVLAAAWRRPAAAAAPRQRRK
jgi:alpha-1,3-mannosyltransferase